MQKSPGSRALWRSGLFSLCAGALISLVLLRFLSQLDQPGLTPEDLRRSGAALALQILSISAAAIGFVTYTSLRTRSSLEQALAALTAVGLPGEPVHGDSQSFMCFLRNRAVGHRT